MRLGSYYVRALKKGWILYHRKHENGKRLPPVPVDVLAYPPLGFSVSMTLEQARAACKKLNKNNSEQAQTIRNAADRVSEIVSLDATIFPPENIEAFSALLEEENHGTRKHLKKLKSHFKFAQQLAIDLKIEPYQFKDAERRIYKYFEREKISFNYSLRILDLLNRYAKMVCRKQGRYFEPLVPPRGIPKQRIIESQAQKGRTVRRASEALNPDILETNKPKLKEPFYKYLFISLHFGLRPYEMKCLYKDYAVDTNVDGTQVLQIFQTKVGRTKYIHIITEAQKLALAFIRAGDFQAPPYKLLKGVFKDITLYGGRKAFVDLMLAEGYSIETIRQWMGHTSTATTLKFYKQKNVLKLATPKKIA